jgi:hypothetical protein
MRCRPDETILLYPRGAEISWTPLARLRLKLLTSISFSTHGFSAGMQISWPRFVLRASAPPGPRSKEGFEPSDESLRLKTRGDNGGALTRSTAGVACPLYGPATTDIDLNGYFIHKGERVILSIIAANHDPDRCSCPNQLDVTRRDGGHLTWERGRTLV